MPKIKLLPQSVISKIAAGEVIERPSYVVKELIENSIDASATQIDVEIEDSGLALISVADNGFGIGREDLILSIKPHATSKISTIEDLGRIKTFGFRGEALTSIANVSVFSMESKRKKDKFGNRLRKIKDELIVEPTALENGTKVTVQQLFDNVPTRKKFLGSKRTELKHIFDTFIDFALYHENIGLRLKSDGKLIYDILRKQKIEERISNIFGEEIINNLFTINYKGSYLSISGFLGHPQVSFSSNSKIFVYINGRKISNSLINSAIREAYENLLQQSMSPMAILYIDLPAEIVDVNIHPRKEDVRFLIPEQVYSDILKGASSILKKNNLTFNNVSWKKSEVGSYAGKILKEEIVRKTLPEENFEIIQIKKTYLIRETKQGVAFFDQHAAHEAIIFRKLKKAFLQKISQYEKTDLESPILLKLSKGEIEILWEQIKTLKKLGYSIEDFGDGSPILTAVPKLLQDRDHTEIIREILERASQFRKFDKIDNKSYKMLSYIACRSAIKGGQTLSLEERKKLIDELENEDFLYTCPHGRPVKIEINLNQLHRIFKRK